MTFSFIEFPQSLLATFPHDVFPSPQLTHWGQRNNTAEELFKHLHALGMHQSMAVLKPCVPKHLHAFMKAPPPTQQHNASPGVSRNPAPPPPPVPADRIYRDNIDGGGGASASNFNNSAANNSFTVLNNNGGGGAAADDLLLFPGEEALYRYQN